MKFFFPRSGVHTIAKKTDVEQVFFQFLMLNISSIKELLHKPLEIQWNITGTLKGKLKEKFLGLYPTRYHPLKSQKTWEVAILGVPWGPGNQCGIQFYFMILWISEIFSLSLLVKNSFHFKLGFFTYFKYISGGIIKKNILNSDYHIARWYWCKKRPEKPPTNFTCFFSMLHCEFFIAMSINGSKHL